MSAHVYLSPGMFGFEVVASFAYFEHVARALERRFANRGRSCSCLLYTSCVLRPWFTAFAMPKSSTRAVPSRPTRMLSGEMSRWMLSLIHI